MKFLVSNRAARPQNTAQRFRKFLLPLCLLTLPLSMPAHGQAGKPAASCESLAKLALPDTTITMAQTVGAGEFVVPEERRPAAPGGANAPRPEGAGGCR